LVPRGGLTLSNLFIGFPVPRAKIADMISGGAPPLDHAFNHFPDGSDPIALPGDISAGQVLGWNGTKFVGAALPSVTVFASPISIHPSRFLPLQDDVDFYCNYAGLRKRTDPAAGQFYSPLVLPNGLTITKLTMYAYCMVAGSVVSIRLNYVTNAGVQTQMAECENYWSDGDGSDYDDSITSPVIDNINYSYCIHCIIDPNTDVLNSILRRVMIDFT